MNTSELIPRPAAGLAEDWMVAVFIIVLCAFAAATVRVPRYFTRLSTTIANLRIMRQVMREELESRRINLLFDLGFALVSGMLIYLATRHFGVEVTPKANGFFQFVLISCGIGGLYLIKLFSTLLVQFLSGEEGGFREYRYNILLTNRVLCVALFPVAVFAAYSTPSGLENWLVVGGLLFVGMVLYRMVRGVLGAMDQGIPAVYIIFYICTLEILPSALLLKWLGLV